MFLLPVGAFVVAKIWKTFNAVVTAYLNVLFNNCTTTPSHSRFLCQMKMETKKEKEKKKPPRYIYIYMYTSNVINIKRR